jgi:hypothetical protein
MPVLFFRGGFTPTWVKGGQKSSKKGQNRGFLGGLPLRAGG